MASSLRAVIQAAALSSSTTAPPRARRRQQFDLEGVGQPLACKRQAGAVQAQRGAAVLLQRLQLRRRQRRQVLPYQFRAGPGAPLRFAIAAQGAGQFLLAAQVVHAAQGQRGQGHAGEQHHQHRGDAALPARREGASLHEGAARLVRQLAKLRLSPCCALS
ncbi:hypothetical protein JOS77_16690 [Chromobacterium haemolyticum]|nr:hypothetical protein JOS77_16690 [Chromobacterium haemolyticum]